NPAALHRPAEHRDDIAVAVIGSTIAILAHGAAEFGQHDHNGILPVTAESLGERRKPVAERAQPLGQLAYVTTLPNLGVPAAETDDGKADLLVVHQQPGEPFGLRRKTVRRRRAGIG